MVTKVACFHCTTKVAIAGEWCLWTVTLSNYDTISHRHHLSCVGYLFMLHLSVNNYVRCIYDLNSCCVYVFIERVHIVYVPLVVRILYIQRLDGEEIKMCFFFFWWIYCSLYTCGWSLIIDILVAESSLLADVALHAWAEYLTKSAVYYTRSVLLLVP